MPWGVRKMVIGRVARIVGLIGAIAAATASVAVAQDNYLVQREAMVARLVEAGVVSDARITAAMTKIERHLFVPHGQTASSYDDTSLPIGHEQVLATPSLTALMLGALRLEPTHRVLEIGTGAGYQTALLAELARHVYSTEVVEPLHVATQERILGLGYTNVTLRNAEGYAGWPEHQPYDRIIVNCAPTQIPQALLDQLRDGGLMVIPLTEEEGWAQTLYLIEKRGDELVRTPLTYAIFAPLLHAAPPPELETEPIEDGASEKT